MLNIHELNVFLTAAETENFSEAGRRLNISQPAVSMQIRALEDSLGIKLFHRTGRHIVLTEAGHKLVPMARDLLNRAAQIEEAMSSLRGNVVGQLRFACGPTVSKYLMPRLVSLLRQHHPRVTVSCTVTSNPGSLRLLLEGEVQIAISNVMEPHKEIEYQSYLTDRVSLMVHPQHPWAARKGPVQLKELAAESLIVCPEDSCDHGILRDALAAHTINLDDLSVTLIVNSPESICASVAEGIGVAFVSEMVAADAIRAGRVVPVALEGFDLCHTYYMAYHVNRPASMAQAAFWDLVFGRDVSEEDLPGQYLFDTLASLDPPTA
ncbi:MAG: selenium metabolism-associated LysR family transcriptional regulator [Anaerolineae bacterium]